MFYVIWVTVAFAIGAIGGYKINPRKLALKKKKNEIDIAERKQESLNASLENLKNNIITAQKELVEEQQKLQRFKDNFQLILDGEAEKLYQELEQRRKDYEEEYQDCLQHHIDFYQTKINKKEEELKDIQAELEKERKKQDYLINSYIKDYKDKEKIKNHLLHINEQDLKDIKKLRQVTEDLNNKLIVNKLIWKQYYEKPLKDLLLHSIGTEKISGIYKITNLANNKVYIGQSVDVAERIKTHVKRGLGAELIVASQLYPAMLKEGVENFSYELIMKCPKEDLDKEEKYWIQFYRSNEFGYNGTKGNN